MKIRHVFLLGLLIASPGFTQDSLNVRRVGRLAGWGEAPGIAVRDSLVFVGTETGLRIVNIADPAAPQLIGTLTAPGYCYGVAVQGDYVYLGSLETGLRVVNVSDPAQPIIVGTYLPQPGLIQGVAVAGNYVYASDFFSGLRVINVNDPSTPTPSGLHDTAGQPVGVSVVNSLAYVGAAGAGLRIIDISDTSNLREVGFYDTPFFAADLDIDGNLVYVADGQTRIIDVSDPSAPFEAGSIRHYEDVQFLATAEGYVYIVDIVGGLRVLDCHNPAQPEETGHYDMVPRPFGVAVAGEYVIVVDLSSFVIYDCSAALSAPPARNVGVSTFAMYPLYPNPFNAMTTITLDLPNQLRGRLVAYDGLGREVRTLTEGILQAGSHEIRFDGSGLSSGNYFVRLESPSFSAVQKAVLLK
jgi:hypothetical protein